MPARNVGSFRDPSGHIYESKGGIFRTVAPIAAPEYEATRDSGLMRSLVDSQKLVDFGEVGQDRLSGLPARAAYILEHPRLSFISYPYEWSFSLLRDAALFHLDLHLEVLERGFTLSDASAYNIQFNGPHPIFIDHLSLRRYRDGEFWTGHRQFCEQFLNPLLLRSLFGVPHNSWYRGNLEGISVGDIAKLVRFRHKFSWNMLSHVVLQNRFQQGVSADKAPSASLKERRLPLSGYKGLLKQLRNWIGRLTPERLGSTVWGNYATTHTYSGEEEAAKKQFVADFVKASGVKTTIDLGCNTGDYSKIALECGGERALGFDFDQQALDRAHHRAKDQKLNFLPLFLDAKNPSPDQGWRQAERSGLATRTKADAVFALAFEHHLTIAHNVPLEQVIGWITDIAPRGVLEFVPKSDPTVQKMLALREDIFPDYTEENFARILSSLRRVEKKETVSNSGRVLYAFGA